MKAVEDGLINKTSSLDSHPVADRRQHDDVLRICREVGRAQSGDSRVGLAQCTEGMRQPADGGRGQLLKREESNENTRAAPVPKEGVVLMQVGSEIQCGASEGCGFSGNRLEYGWHSSDCLGIYVYIYFAWEGFKNREKPRSR